MNKLTIAALLLPMAMPAANIVVWNYDSLDRWLDPALAESVDCSYWVARTLRDQGNTVAVTERLPADLSGYDIAFCLMGWFRC